MFNMTDVALADKLAGGPRDDLEDVVLGAPVVVDPTLHRVPAGVPLLDWLQTRTEQHETAEIFKKFYENPDGEDWDVIADDIVRQHKSADSVGPRSVTRMYLEYGAELYERCPHLKMYDVWVHLQELGFPHSKWAVYRFFNRNDHSNTTRSRTASNNPSNKGAADD